MLFSVVARYKPGAAAKTASMGLAFTAHLEQPLMSIRLAGPLRDADGETTGFMAILEAKSFEEARSWVDSSPNQGAGLYERVDIAELEPEVGRL